MAEKPMRPESDILFEKLKKELKKKGAKIMKEKGVFQFDILGAAEGSWTIDLNKSPISIRKSKSKDPDVTFCIQDKHLMHIAKGELDIATAFVQGRLEITGNNEMALAFGNMIGQLPTLVN
jgi:putative sterol carrier protein